ncbi:hypothetical protein [Pedobacter frigoris]|uniref:hypothetical protein n=1 Tax=Pedobacter frigoris TaxID=2571272 RepID=UPI00292D9F52|nr:hypothetical protein [Pedobacter frigoris]
MSVSRKEFIGLLGAGVGTALLPAVALANPVYGKNGNEGLLPLPQNRKTFISYRYFLPWAPEWGDQKMADARLEELVTFGHEAGINSFQFYVNTPMSSYYILPPDAESQTGWVKWMREIVAPRIRKEGFSLELNFQQLLGANAGNTDLRPLYRWKQYMVDSNGETSKGTPCPEDKLYREDISKMLREWASLKPDILWIDDDFRLHNHSTRGMFCYCPEHLNKFAALTGKTYTREDLLKEVLQPGKPSDLRNKWLDFLGDYMADFAKWVADEIHVVSPETRVALMTSGTDIHSLEGRDWKKVLGNFAGKHKPLIRPTFGLYMGTGSAPKALSSGLKDIISQVQVVEQSLGEGNCDFAPELENTRYTSWSKSTAHSTHSLIMGQLMGLSMITVAVNDLDGSPLSEEPSLVPLFRNARPRMEALADLGLKSWPVQGVISLSDKDVARMTQLAGKASYAEMAPAARFENPIFDMGIPFNYMTAANAAKSGYPVLLEASSVWKANDEELRKILAGSALVTTGAARIIIERGFGDLLGVKVGEHHTNTIQSEVYEDHILPNVSKIRVPHRGADWDELETTTDSAKVASYFMDFLGGKHIGTVVYQNKAGGRIVVYAQNSDMQGGLFGSHARLRWLHGVLSWLSNGNYQALPILPHHGISLLKKKNNNTFMYSFCNLGTDVLTEFKLRWNGASGVKSVSMLKKDGTWKVLSFTVDRDRADMNPIIKFDCELGVMEWLVLLIA